MGGCTICPRMCGINRTAQAGLCGAVALPRVARAALHFWEEPYLVGKGGAGAVFFSGCNLRCVFCQNADISQAPKGSPRNEQALCELYLDLQAQGAETLDLVTPTPHTDVVIRSLALAKQHGLHIPVVYNTNAYERVETLRRLEGLVDIYLPDLKYVSEALSAAYSGAADYFHFAAPAIQEMQRQTGTLVTGENGVAVRGLAIRHLVLPGSPADTRLVLNYIKDSLPADTALSLLRQYTPMGSPPPPLDRRLTDREYERAAQYCIDIGLSRVLLQDKESASAAYTPEFFEDLSGRS